MMLAREEGGRVLPRGSRRTCRSPWTRCASTARGLRHARQTRGGNEHGSPPATRRQVWRCEDHRSWKLESAADDRFRVLPKSAVFGGTWRVRSSPRQIAMATSVPSLMTHFGRRRTNRRRGQRNTQSSPPPRRPPTPPRLPRLQRLPQSRARFNPSTCRRRMLAFRFEASTI